MSGSRRRQAVSEEDTPWHRDTGGQSAVRQARRDEEIDEVAGARGQPRGRRAAREATEDVDDLLDEIDSVLEENAEEFVRGYVQKGGQ